jgi:RNA polymerase sigma factor (TIGR02999 family)
MNRGRGEHGPGEATLLLERVRAGDDAAAQALLPLVYDQLRAMAGSYFRGQRSDHTLQPTALVHEAYVKLVQGADIDWQSEAHFCAVAARAMRQILTDHARAKAALKRGGGDRGGGVEGVPLEGVTSPSGDQAIDPLVLEEALMRLEQVDERQARIVELWFFGGLTVEQVAMVLGTSTSTIERAWRRCRAWLAGELSGEATGT